MTQDQIAVETSLSRSTVNRILKKRGLGLLSALEPKEPRPRYERETPGEIIHIDIKKLGCFNRLGHQRSLPRGIQRNPSGRKEAERHRPSRGAVAYYKRLGVTIARVMTDNGPCYKSQAFCRACRRLGIKHLRTKPYTPQTNGKAERFIQTALREWAYATAYTSSAERKAELPISQHRYNWHRPHGGIEKVTPISRRGRPKLPIRISR